MDREYSWTGISRTTGRPRLVTTIGLPVAATRSMISRHLALNSVAPMATTGGAPFRFLTTDMVRSYFTLVPRATHGQALPDLGRNESALRRFPQKVEVAAVL